jgi:hypothetical protein
MIAGRPIVFDGGGDGGDGGDNNARKRSRQL